MDQDSFDDFDDNEEMHMPPAFRVDEESGNIFWEDEYGNEHSKAIPLGPGGTPMRIFQNYFIYTKTSKKMYDYNNRLLKKGSLTRAFMTPDGTINIGDMGYIYLSNAKIGIDFEWAS